MFNSWSSPQLECFSLIAEYLIYFQIRIKHRKFVSTTQLLCKLNRSIISFSREPMSEKKNLLRGYKTRLVDIGSKGNTLGSKG